MDILNIAFLEEENSPRQRVEKGSKADKRRDMNRKQERSFADSGCFYDD